MTLSRSVYWEWRLSFSLTCLLLFITQRKEGLQAVVGVRKHHSPPLSLHHFHLFHTPAFRYLYPGKLQPSSQDRGFQTLALKLDLVANGGSPLPTFCQIQKQSSRHWSQGMRGQQVLSLLPSLLIKRAPVDFS